MSLLFQISSQPAHSQNQPNVSVVNLSVQTDDKGKQMVLTPRGFLVPLPGAGVTTNAVQMYMGRDGGFWYVDWTGKSTDITEYVAQVRAQTDRVLAARGQQAQGQPTPAPSQYQQAAPPQYAPYVTSYGTNTPPPNAVQGGSQQYAEDGQGQPYDQNAQNQQYAQTQTSGSSGGSGAAGTALAAGLGAMAGTAASAAYYNRMPYGTPYYYGPHGNQYYHDDHGKDVFVDDGQVQWNNVAAASSIQNSRQQQKVNQAKSYQQQRTANQQPPAQQQAHAQQPPTRELSQQGRDRFQQQQNWYQNQTKDSDRASAWRQQSQGDNPFVRQTRDGSDSQFASRRGSGGEGDRSFGGRDGGGSDGGGFGGRAGGREAGGFQGRVGGGGGRAGGRAGGGGRRGR